MNDRTETMPGDISPAAASRSRLPLPGLLFAILLVLLLGALLWRQQHPGASHTGASLASSVTAAGRIDNARATALYADALRHDRQGDRWTEEATLKQIAQARPDDPQAHWKLAEFYWEHNRFTPGAAEIRTVVRLRPNDPRAHIGLAQQLLFGSQWKDCAIEARRAIALKPDDADAWETLGSSLAHQDRVDDAIPAYERSLRLNANRLDAYANLSWLYGLRNRDRDAIRMGEEFLRRYPTGQERLAQLVYKNLGYSYCKTKQWDRAEAMNRNVLQAEPDDCQALLNLGCALAATGRTPEARQLWQRVLTLKPEPDQVSEVHRQLALHPG